MLHIVNKSAGERAALDSCLRMVRPGAALLLIEDGVYSATRGNPAEARVRGAMQTVKVYALAPDLEARGMKDAVMDGVELVDYRGFVDLVVASANVQSWL